MIRTPWLRPRRASSLRPAMERASASGEGFCLPATTRALLAPSAAAISIQPPTQATSGDVAPVVDRVADVGVVDEQRLEGDAGVVHCRAEFAEPRPVAVLHVKVAELQSVDAVAGD